MQCLFEKYLFAVQNGWGINPVLGETSFILFYLEIYLSWLWPIVVLGAM